MGSLKSSRTWLTPQTDTNSCVIVSVNSGTVELSLSDCHRTIDWTFWRANKADLVKSRRKIAKLKAIVDAVYAELHREPPK